MSEEAKEPREWLYVGNFISQSGEKYTILNGPDIGSNKIWLVEKSAYLQAIKERDEWKNEYQNLCKFATQFEEQRDEWRSKALDCEKHPVVIALTKERDELQAEIEKLNEKLAGYRETDRTRDEALVMKDKAVEVAIAIGFEHNRMVALLAESDAEIARLKKERHDIKCPHCQKNFWFVQELGQYPNDISAACSHQELLSICEEALELIMPHLGNWQFATAKEALTKLKAARGE